MKNPNESKSTILAFVVAALFAFITYFLMSESIQTVFTKTFFIALLFLGIRVYFLTRRIKFYYKEK